MGTAHAPAGEVPLLFAAVWARVTARRAQDLTKFEENGTLLLLGWTFDRAGQTDSARSYLARYADSSGANRILIDQQFLTPGLYRLGGWRRGWGCEARRGVLRAVRGSLEERGSGAAAARGRGAEATGRGGQGEGVIYGY